MYQDGKGVSSLPKNKKTPENQCLEIIKGVRVSNTRQSKRSSKETAGFTRTKINSPKTRSSNKGVRVSKYDLVLELIRVYSRDTLTFPYRSPSKESWSPRTSYPLVRATRTKDRTAALDPQAGAPMDITPSLILVCQHNKKWT